VVGGGEHARVVAEAARSSGRISLLGFVDPHACEETTRRLALPWLGDDAALAELDAMAVLGVGAAGTRPVRQDVVARVHGLVRGWMAVVHAAAWVSPTAVVEDGAFISAGATVNSGARVGRHCIVNSGAVVEHDVVLGDFALIAPGAVIGGGSVIGGGAFIGLGAILRDHVHVGAGAMVKMGTVVLADVPEGARIGGPMGLTRGSPDAGNQA
jgi:acetyltransferase EpsM